jgi:hypothetical protein
MTLLPGKTIDERSYDPDLKEGTQTVVTRLGPQELALFKQTANNMGLTRSNLARRLIVEGLLALREKQK